MRGEEKKLCGLGHYRDERLGEKAAFRSHE